MTEQERAAIENSIPREPIVHELGGGYYYTCPWMSCGNTVHKWDRYCSKCGQRLLFEKDDEQRDVYIVKDGEERKFIYG